MKLSLLFVGLLISIALADKGRNDDGDHNRDVTFKNDGNRIRFESDRRGNRIRFELDTGNEIELILRYYERLNDTANFYRFRVRFYSLIEYTEVNGVAGFQEGDTIFAVQRFQNFDWSNIACGKTGDRFDCSLNSTGVNAGLIGLAFHVTGTTTEVDGYRLDPTSMKIDVNIDKPNKQPGNNLAIDTRFITLSGKQVDKDSNDGDKVVVSDISFYSWVPYALQNGTNVTVVSSTLATSDDDVSDNDDRRRDGGNGGNSGDSANRENEGNSDIAHKIFFSFLTTSNAPIYWDPTLGMNPSVVNPSTSAAISVVPCFALFFAAFALLF